MIARAKTKLADPHILEEPESPFFDKRKLNIGALNAVPHTRRAGHDHGENRARSTP